MATRTTREKRIEEYRRQSNEADTLANNGNKEEALAILRACRESAVEAGDEDYRLFFEAEIIGYTETDFPRQIELVKQALAWDDKMGREKEYFLLRNMGAYYSLQGNEDAAIALYDQALAMNPKDVDALRQKGVALAKKGEIDAAIALFDQTLAINPQDSDALRNKGVALSKKGEDDAAIALYDQALAYNPQDSDALRQKGVSLFRKGDEDAAIALFDQALALNPQDSDALRQKGVALSQKGDEDAAIALYGQTLALNPQDSDALRQKGVSLSKKGDEDAAIALYDQALALNPNDVDALRQKGVSLSKKGDEDAAIALYDQALAFNPQDSDALRQKGVSLFRKGDEDAAISLFDQALALNPRDASVLREKSVAEFHGGRWDDAFRDIIEAVKLAPQKYRDVFRTLCALIGKDPDEEWNKIVSCVVHLKSGPEERMADLRGLIRRIREDFGTELQGFLTEKQEAKNKYKEFLGPQSSLDAELSLFMVLRKWNSWTPALPNGEDERSRGGGYFLWHAGKGTVIDPGYNFIENFFNAGGKLRDIDHIVITHAHNDHTADFESLCALLHEFNQENKGNCQTITLFVNNGAFLKLSGMLNLQDHDYLKTVVTLNADTSFTLQGNLQMTVLPAYHDELLARDQSIGLLFTVGKGKNARRILLTSDTGLFPLKPGAGKLTPNEEGEELWKRPPYPKLQNALDLMVVHIGSIKEEELTGNFDELKNVMYPNHLGIIGTARMVTMLRPRLAIISEFGEEMRDFREKLIRGLQNKVIDKFFENDPAPHIPRVAPGDLPFIYNITERKFYCCGGERWEDIAKIEFKENKADGNVYYLCDDRLHEFDTNENLFTKSIRDFKTNRECHTELYFRK